MQVNAELIVTFEGTTEFGNPFMARQSYLPTEIHWGHKFVSILQKPPPGQTRYHVDISKQVTQLSWHPSKSLLHNTYASHKGATELRDPSW